MPFTNRDRLRGKTNQEFIDKINSAFGSRSPRMLFDTPQWSTRANFPRGFPFDDDSDEEIGRFRRERPTARGGFFDGFGDAKGVHEPPWAEERQPKKRVVEEQRAAPSLNQHGLRNTVPLAQAAKPERSARAMSAPPGDRSHPRFTTTCEIPVMGNASAKPPSATSSGGNNNVRVIPIQVEGRDEPLINADIDTSAHFPQPEPNKFDARLPRDFGSFRKHSPRFQQQHQQQQQQQPPPPPDEPDKPDKPGTVDPSAQAIARINDIQLKIEELAKQVEQAEVSSRKDKQYVLLDELLTVQLLQLDNVDPEGHDNVRQARKDAIRAIQKCIAVLESKVPGEAPMEVDPVADSAEPQPDDTSVTTETTVEPLSSPSQPPQVLSEATETPQQSAVEP